LISISSKSFTINLTFKIDKLKLLLNDSVNSGLNFLDGRMVIAFVLARLE